VKALILTIGDELLIGQVVNTNAASIAQHLNGAGVEVARMLTVGDGHGEIDRALAEGVRDHDLVLITGGLGPTHDDITKRALCRFFGTDLVSDPGVRATIEDFLRQRGASWTEASEEQTMVPRACTVIPNAHGTAPGELFERDGKIVIAMPGVPYEMEAMMTQTVVPYVRAKAGGAAIVHRTLRTTGIPESVLAAKFGDVETLLEGASLAFLPSPTGVRLRITVVDTDADNARARVERIEERIRAVAQEYIYGTGDEELEDVVGAILAAGGLTLAVAESCTGGLIAHRLTNVPGSSRYLLAGVVSYSNPSKTSFLGVPEALLAAHGAVSEEVARAMAAGVRSATGASIGLATTGIAGPTGATAGKPVGLVWIGYADARGAFAQRYQLGGTRIRIKERASQAALELLRRALLESAA
jgi:nicotinamide-nucleotide amidase